ncbi:MAG: hypothetical protein LBP22_08785 [Deltaproteobacteria bacterium]|jgi:hypothetical protein|nr:hypothetical protein [Deltaproteobacteria bacterium]
MTSALNTSAALELEGLDDLEPEAAEAEVLLEGLDDLEPEAVEAEVLLEGVDEASEALTPEDFLTYALTHRVLHSEEWVADRAAWQA